MSLSVRVRILDNLGHGLLRWKHKKIAIERRSMTGLALKSLVRRLIFP
jgi:hypothetical protein